MASSNEWWERPEAWRDLETADPGFTSWANRYYQEHGFYPGGGNDEDVQQAVSNREWSEAVHQATGTPPTERMWKAHYYRPDELGDVGQWYGDAGRVAQAAIPARTSTLTPYEPMETDSAWQQSLARLNPTQAATVGLLPSEAYKLSRGTVAEQTAKAWLPQTYPGEPVTSANGRADLEALLRAEAERQGLSDYVPVLQALIDQESGWDPTRVNPTSMATGLMQIMPSDVSETYGGAFDTRPSSEELLDPATNIAAGVADFKAKLEAAEGDLTQALTNYSGGYDTGTYADPVIERARSVYGYTSAEATPFGGGMPTQALEAATAKRPLNPMDLLAGRDRYGLPVSGPAAGKMGYTPVTPAEAKTGVTPDWRKRVLEAYHFRPEAVAEVAETTTGILHNPRVAGSGGLFWPEGKTVGATQTTEVFGRQPEAVAHESAHAWFQRHYEGQADYNQAFFEAVNRLAEEHHAGGAQEYPVAGALAEAYIYGVAEGNWTGMYNSDQTFNTTEAYAGLVSGVGGDVNAMPQYLRPFFQEMLAPITVSPVTTATPHAITGAATTLGPMRTGEPQVAGSFQQPGAAPGTDVRSVLGTPQGYDYRRALGDYATQPGDGMGTSRRPTGPKNAAEIWQLVSAMQPQEAASFVGNLVQGATRVAGVGVREAAQAASTVLANPTVAGVLKGLQQAAMTAEQGLGAGRLASLTTQERQREAAFQRDRNQLAALRAAGLGDSREAVLLQQSLDTQEAERNRRQSMMALEAYAPETAALTEGETWDQQPDWNAIWEASRSGLYSDVADAGGRVSLAYERIAAGEDAEAVVQELAQTQLPAAEMVGQTILDPLNFIGVLTKPLKAAVRVRQAQWLVRAATSATPEAALDVVTAAARAERPLGKVGAFLDPFWATRGNRQQRLLNESADVLSMLFADTGGDAAAMGERVAALVADPAAAAERFGLKTLASEPGYRAAALLKKMGGAEAWQRLVTDAATDAAATAAKAGDQTPLGLAVTRRMFEHAQKTLDEVVPDLRTAYGLAATPIRELRRRPLILGESIDSILHTAFLGLNPGYGARNLYGNVMPGGTDGLLRPFETSAMRRAYQARFGAVPIKASLGIGVAGSQPQHARDIVSRNAQWVERQFSEMYTHAGVTDTMARIYPDSVDETMQPLRDLLTRDQSRALQVNLDTALNANEIRASFRGIRRSVGQSLDPALTRRLGELDTGLRDAVVRIHQTSDTYTTFQRRIRNEVLNHIDDYTKRVSVIDNLVPIDSPLTADAEPIASLWAESVTGTGRGATEVASRVLSGVPEEVPPLRMPERAVLPTTAEPGPAPQVARTEPVVTPPVTTTTREMGAEVVTQETLRIQGQRRTVELPRTRFEFPDPATLTPAQRLQIEEIKARLARDLGQRQAIIMRDGWQNMAPEVQDAALRQHFEIRNAGFETAQELHQMGVDFRSMSNHWRDVFQRAQDALRGPGAEGAATVAERLPGPPPLRPTADLTVSPVTPHVEQIAREGGALAGDAERRQAQYEARVAAARQQLHAAADVEVPAPAATAGVGVGPRRVALAEGAHVYDNLSGPRYTGEGHEWVVMKTDENFVYLRSTDRVPTGRQGQLRYLERRWSRIGVQDRLSDGTLTPVSTPPATTGVGVPAGRAADMTEEEWQLTQRLSTTQESRRLPGQLVNRLWDIKRDLPKRVRDRDGKLYRWWQSGRVGDLATEYGFPSDEAFMEAVRQEAHMLEDIKGLRGPAVEAGRRVRQARRLVEGEEGALRLGPDQQKIDQTVALLRTNLPSATAATSRRGFLAPDGSWLPIEPLLTHRTAMLETPYRGAAESALADGFVRVDAGIYQYESLTTTTREALERRISDDFAQLRSRGYEGDFSVEAGRKAFILSYDEFAANDFRLPDEMVGGGGVRGAMKGFLGGESGQLRVRTATRYASEPAEAMRRNVQAILDDAKATWGKGQPLEPARRQAANAALAVAEKRAIEELNTAKTLAMRVGEATRDFALHDYSATLSIDTLASAYLLYPYWSMRSYPKWLARTIMNPGVAAAYLRYKETLQKINADLPENWRNRVWVKMPGMNQSIGIDLDRALNPMVNLMDNWSDEDAQKGLLGQALTAIESVGLSAHPLFAWAYAGNAALQGDEEAALSRAGYFSPLTRTFKYATAALGLNNGQGFTVEPWLWMGQPWTGGDKWERDNWANILGMMEKEGVDPNLTQYAAHYLSTGELPEDPALAQQVKDTLVAARQRAIGPRGIAAAVSFLFGLNVKPEGVGEREWATAQDELSALWDSAETMDAEDFSAALRQFYLDHPGMNTAAMGKKRGEEAVRSWSWNVLNRIPPGNGKVRDAYIVDALGEGVTQDMLDRFRDDGFTSFTPREVEIWQARMLDLAAEHGVPAKGLTEEWQRVYESRREMYAEMDDRWPGWRDWQDRYFTLKGSDEAAASAYLQESGLSTVWAFKDQWGQTHPEYAWYYGDAPRDQASGIIWDIWHALEQGGVDRRNVREQLGPQFEADFLDPSGNKDAISNAQLLGWLAALGTMADQLGIGDQVTRSLWTEAPGEQVPAPVKEPYVSSGGQMVAPGGPTAGQVPLGAPVVSTGGPTGPVAGAPAGGGQPGTAVEPSGQPATGAGQPLDLADAGTAQAYRDWKTNNEACQAGDQAACATLDEDVYDQFRGPAARAWRLYYDTIVPGWRAEEAGFFRDPTIAKWMDPDTRDQVDVNDVIKRMQELKRLMPDLTFGNEAEYGQARDEQEGWKEASADLMPGTMPYRQARLEYAQSHPIWAKYYVRDNELQRLGQYAQAGWQYPAYSGGGGGGGSASRRRRRSTSKFKVSRYYSKRQEPKFSKSSLWYQITKGG